MPLPVIPDTYRCALNWEIGIGQSAVNVIHILRASATASLIASSIDANVTTNMWNAISTTALMNMLVVTPLDGSSASFSLATSGAKWSGGSAGDVLPQVSVLVKAQTQLRGRSHRGRSFLPGIAEGAVAGGFLGAPAQALMQTAWNNFLAAMIAAGSQPVIASYKLSSQVPISSYTVELATGTQRRRMTRLR